MSKIVSVIIPCYNSSLHIKEAVQSVLDQTYPDIEIIIVDDGSTDESLNMVKSLYSANNNIFIKSQLNKGACAARNLGFQVSKGHYIQYLDADDILSPDKIASQLLQIEHSKGIIASCRWDKFYNSPDECSFPFRYLDKSWNNPADWLKNSWLGKGMGQTSIWLTPRDLIKMAGPWNEKLSVNQDGEFFSRVLLQASRIVFSEKAKVYYRSGNPQSISQSNIYSRVKAESLLESYRLYQTNVNQHASEQITDNLSPGLATNYLTFIYQYDIYFPDLTTKAFGFFAELGFNKAWAVGGGTFKKLSSVIGFRNALKLKRILVKMK